MTKQATVLLVEDFEPWRVQLRKIVEEHPEWKILSEASDGAEGVEKAIDLQPDIILLDVGLPTLNGIEAGKLIRQRCPASRIVFVTQDGDAEVRQAALDIGDGFVRKADAARELASVIAAAPNNGGGRHQKR